MSDYWSSLFLLFSDPCARVLPGARGQGCPATTPVIVFSVGLDWQYLGYGPDWIGSRANV